MAEATITSVHFKREDELQSYYDHCGLLPALKFSGLGEFDFRKVTYSSKDIVTCSTFSASGWGFEKEQYTDYFFFAYTRQGSSMWELDKFGLVEASNQLCVIDGAKLVAGQFAPCTYTETFRFHKAEIIQHIEDSVGQSELSDFEFQSLLPSGHLSWRLISPVLQCIRNGFNQSVTKMSPLSMSYMKQALLSSVVDTIPNNFKVTSVSDFKAANPKHLAKAIDYIHSHASKEIMIADLAKYACTSVRNIQLVFKLHHNMSPMQYLREVRLASARMDLLNEDLRLSWQQIALQWGFSDVNLFSRYYKRQYGETPFQTQYKVKGSFSKTV